MEQEEKKRIRRHDGDARAKALLDAAIEIFAERGFQEASVRMITAKAKTNISAIKYYFVDKVGLYHAAIEEAHAQLLSEETMPDWEQQPAKEALQTWFGFGVRAALRAHTRTHAHSRLLLRAASETSDIPGLEQLAAQMAQPMRAVVASILLRLFPKAPHERIEHAVGFVLMWATRFSEGPKALARLGVELPQEPEKIERFLCDAWDFLYAGICALFVNEAFSSKGE